MDHMADILDHDILEEIESRALPESTHYGSMLVSGLGHPKARVIHAANSPPRRVLMENLQYLDDWTESRTIGSRYSSQVPLRIMQSHQEEVLKMQITRYQNVELRNGWMVDDFQIDEDVGVTAKLIEVNEERRWKATSKSRWAYAYRETVTCKLYCWLRWSHVHSRNKTWNQI